MSASPPELREARFEDYDGIARLGLTNSLRTQSPDEWARMWRDSPAWPRLGAKWPIGWVLEAETGEIVGSFMNVPSLYKFHGQEFVCGASRAWAVAPEYRGYGLLLMDEYLNQTSADLCMMTTAGPMAQPVVDKLTSRVPVGDWAAYSYWLIGYSALVRRKLDRHDVPLSAPLGVGAAYALMLRDWVFQKPLARLPPRFSVECTDRFDERFDTFWDELVRQRPHTLLADRSQGALSCHFGTASRDGRLWVFTASLGARLVAYCVVTQLGEPGKRYARLVDFQTIEPETQLLPGLLRAALKRCARSEVHLLEHLGRGVPKMAAVDRSAPYRKRLASWRFFYRAANQGLEKELRSPQCWDPSVYDGDASLD